MLAGIGNDMATHRKNAKHTSIDRLRLWHRFHIRLTTLYAGTVFLTLVTMGVASYHFRVDTTLNDLKQRLMAIVTSLSQTVDGSVIAGIPVDTAQTTSVHEELLKQFSRIANADPDIDSIYVLRPTNEPTKLRFFVDYSKSGGHGKPGEIYYAGKVPMMLNGFEKAVVEDQPYIDRFGLSLSGYAPVRTPDGLVIGVVGVDVLYSQLGTLKSEALKLTLAMFGVSGALIGLVSLVVARSVRKPLSSMITATTAVARGELDTQLDLERHDEFGVLGNHFDAMAAGLREREFIRETFGRYVSKDVASALLADGNTPALGGEERVVTIMFSDLRNYTTISECMSPAQMVDMLNHYLGAMSEVLETYQGCVIEFLGDGILAVFGAPHYIPDHAEQAVNCAIAMRSRLAELNTEWSQTGLANLWLQNGIEKLEARVGIHTGTVVAGNLGSRTRMKYAVIGDSVNVAARLETLNKELNTSILLSEDVKIRLPPDLAARVSDQGSICVKGRQQAIRTYAI